MHVPGKGCRKIVDDGPELRTILRLGYIRMHQIKCPIIICEEKCY